MGQGTTLFECPACHGPVAYSAASCPHCGYRPPSASRGFNTSAIALGVGGVLIAVGSFLPWATVTTFISLSFSGMDGDGKFTLGIGIILGLVALASLNAERIRGVAGLLGFLGGLAAVAVAIVDGSSVAQYSGASEYALVSVGAGIYAVGVGGAVAMLAALLGVRRPSARTA